MFGDHSHNNQNSTDNSSNVTHPTSAPSVDPNAFSLSDESGNSPVQPTPPSVPSNSFNDSGNSSSSNDDGSSQTNANNDQPSDSPIDDSATAEQPTPAASKVEGPAKDALLMLKSQALQNLTPLIDHLDQSPEERFRTTMMMIQAADDQTLLRSAYEAAQNIGDEKIRAQALLDIVNEINYFTQNH